MVIKLGKYKHYKGNFYELMGICTHSGTLEKLVYYKSIKTNEVWVRPFEMFFETIEKDGIQINRFKLISEHSK